MASRDSETIQYMVDETRNNGIQVRYSWPLSIWRLFLPTVETLRQTSQSLINNTEIHDIILCQIAGTWSMWALWHLHSFIRSADWVFNRNNSHNKAKILLLTKTFLYQQRSQIRWRPNTSRVSPASSFQPGVSRSFRNQTLDRQTSASYYEKIPRTRTHSLYTNLSADHAWLSSSNCQSSANTKQNFIEEWWDARNIEWINERCTRCRSLGAFWEATFFSLVNISNSV